MLPGHRRVGVGRDDGRSAGEHCAIFFDALAVPGSRWRHVLAGRARRRTARRRPCWARSGSAPGSGSATASDGRFLRIYNTHLYLTERARLQAVRLILARIDLGDPADAVLVTGDFNAASRRLPTGGSSTTTGLVSTAELAGVPTGRPDLSVLRNPPAQPGRNPGRSRAGASLDRRVLDVKPENTFPSDHFGVMADLIPADVASDHRGSAPEAW